MYLLNLLTYLINHSGCLVLLLFKIVLYFQTRQPIFVQLLQAAFRVSQCTWLTASQRFNVENCIRTLSEVGKEYNQVINS